MYFTFIYRFGGKLKMYVFITSLNGFTCLQLSISLKVQYNFDFVYDVNTSMMTSCTCVCIQMDLSYKPNPIQGTWHLLSMAIAVSMCRYSAPNVHTCITVQRGFCWFPSVILLYGILMKCTFLSVGSEATDRQSSPSPPTSGRRDAYQTIPTCSCPYWWGELCHTDSTFFCLVWVHVHW